MMTQYDDRMQGVTKYSIEHAAAGPHNRGEIRDVSYDEAVAWVRKGICSGCIKEGVYFGESESLEEFDEKNLYHLLSTACGCEYWIIDKD